MACRTMSRLILRAVLLEATPRRCRFGFSVKCVPVDRSGSAPIIGRVTCSGRKAKAPEIKKCDEARDVGRVCRHSSLSCLGAKRYNSSESDGSRFFAAELAFAHYP